MLRLAEAQQLNEVLDDPLFRAALEEFCKEMRLDTLNSLVQQVRHKERDTMREAHFAGQVEVFETLISRLQHFALVEMQKAQG